MKNLQYIHWDYEYKEGEITGKDKECKKWEVIGDGEMDDKMKDGEASLEFKQSYYYHNYNVDENGKMKIKLSEKSEKN